MKELFFFEPVVKELIWGREDWVIAAHPNGDCVVKEGSFKGMSLSELYRDKRDLFGDITSERFPLLLKVIDAKDDLSIQVHPDDAYAFKHENGSYGKTECWYILDCESDSKLVIGHNAKSRNELCKLIDNRNFKYLIKEVPVKPGDFVQIPPGTVHAIKGGLKILETQQNSDITYRVYDYDRRRNGKLRELHVEQSKAVICIPGDNVKVMSTETAGGCYELVNCRHYRVDRLNVRNHASYDGGERFLMASVTEGAGMVNGKPVRAGQHFLVPAGFGELNFGGTMTLIISQPGENTDDTSGIL